MSRAAAHDRADGSHDGGPSVAGVTEPEQTGSALLSQRQINRSVAQIQAHRPDVTREELTGALTQLTALCASHALFDMWERGALELGFDGTTLITRVTSPAARGAGR